MFYIWFGNGKKLNLLSDSIMRFLTSLFFIKQLLPVLLEVLRDDFEFWSNLQRYSKLKFDPRKPLDGVNLVNFEKKESQATLLGS